MSGRGKAASEVIRRWDGMLPRPAKAHYVFSKEGDFAALNEAMAFASRTGRRYGSVDCPNPIAVANGAFLVGKWHRIPKESYKDLEGAIVADDFRAGPCVLVEFAGGKP